MQLRIEIERTQSGIPIVHLQGDIDLFTSPDLRTTLNELVETGCRRIVLDMAGVPYVDSAGLGVLMSLARKAGADQGAVYLVAMAPFVERTLEVTHLIRLFNIQDSVAAALEAAG